jgi:hypothetical protein
MASFFLRAGAVAVLGLFIAGVAGAVTDTTRTPEGNGVLEVRTCVFGASATIVALAALAIQSAEPFVLNSGRRKSRRYVRKGSRRYRMTRSRRATGT